MTATAADVRAARDVVATVASRTPIQSSRKLAERLGGDVLLKAEHLQRTGSFKIRGAYNRIARMRADERSRGVVAASAGNHAQGVAWAASELGVPSTIVMPVYASLSKVEATRGYGARVELEGETFEDALGHARDVSDRTGATLVHAFDDPAVIAGQGTVGLEILEDVDAVDRIVVPVGGGGLVAGIALAAEGSDVEIVGVRPAARPDTIADGAAVAELGAHTAAIIERAVASTVHVDEEWISEAIVLCLEWTKQVIEGAGALPLAAMLSGAVPPDGRTVLVVSGGNIDPGLLMRVIRHGLAGSGRYLFVSLVLSDQPGQLQRVLALLADMHVNVLSVVHHRAGHGLPVGGVDVELTLETRDRAHAEEVVDALRASGYAVRS